QRRGRVRRRRLQRIAGRRAGRIGWKLKDLADVLPVSLTVAAASCNDMPPAGQSEGVLNSRDEMTSRRVDLINKRDRWAQRLISARWAKRQISADAQRRPVVLVVLAVFGAGIGVAAVLHAVPEFIERSG